MLKKFLKKNVFNKCKFVNGLTINYDSNFTSINRIRKINFYEPDMEFFFEDLKRKNIVINEIIDVGANIGIITSYIKYLWKSSKVYAFEAEPFTFNHLENLLKTNNIKDINCYNLAVSSSEDSYLKFDTTNSHNISQYMGGVISENGDTTIKTVTLDKFIDENNIKVDLIKIDVDGHEIEVFNGSMKSIEKFLPIVIFEYATNLTSKEDLNLIVERLSSLGYVCYYSYVKYPKYFIYSEDEVIEDNRTCNFYCLHRKHLESFFVENFFNDDEFIFKLNKTKDDFTNYYKNLKQIYKKI